MSAGKLRAILSIAVVLAHIALIIFCAIFLYPRITKLETYISTISIFVPVFGVYVGIVVKSITISAAPAGRKVSKTFITLIVMLFMAYFASIISVVILYSSGVIPNEDLLPAAVGAMEAAFGAYFMALFLTLFDKGR